MDDSLIVKAIQRLHPGWEPPKRGRNRWQSTKCPFHGDENASASVSFEFDAFNCFSCGTKGNWRSLLKKEGGLTDSEINAIAEGLPASSDRAVSSKPARVSRRRVFGDTGPGDIVTPSSGRDRSVHAGIRSRSTPWA